MTADQIDDCKTHVCLPANLPTAMTDCVVRIPGCADPVHIFLFTQVTNASKLRQRLLAGDPEYLYAFLDADMVPASSF